MKVFLDANILFSLSNASSVTHVYLREAAEHCTFVTSSYASAEARRNLQAKRPEWVATFDQWMQNTALADTLQPAGAVDLPEKDRPIMEASIGARCDYLLTGDKAHFGHLYGKSVQGVTVVSLKQFAEVLDAS